MTPKFSIIIPTIKATALVVDCVQSLFAQEPNRSRYEVIVVDDGSTMDVQEFLLDFCGKNAIRFFAKPKNRGFSHSVNIGLKEAVGDIRVLVNNDIVFTRPWLDELEKAFAVHEDIGIVGAKLLYPDGRVQHAGVIRSPSSVSFSHINKFMPGSAPMVNQSRYFISVTGALFAIRKSAQDKIGLFNEDYFIACEDCEYCVRAWDKGCRVYYAHGVEAIHAEGFTRGNDYVTKLKKGPEWFRKEIETFEKFRRDMQRFPLADMDRKIAALNRGSEVEPLPPAVPVRTDMKKLEIGCGHNPQPGYLHLDVRPLPHVEYVCDFSEQKLPFADGEIDELIHNHVIEHISWRKLPFVLSEWRRVMRPGARMILRTPDLEFICKMYLDGKTTPEWPGDEKFVKDFLCEQITPAWWANIKLYGGQDYPSNFHLHCFDFAMLKGVLERHGFERVSRLNIQPVYSPGELQVEAFRAGQVVQNVSSSKHRVLVKRRAALGDTLLTTPVVTRLRTELGADAEIVVATDCGAAYHNNPYVNSVVPANHSPQGFSRVIDLDFAYERNPKMHIVDAYFHAAFGDTDGQKDVFLNVTENDVAVASNVMANAGVDPTKTIVMHAGVSWRNRTWSKDRWQQVAQAVADRGGATILVGSGGDMVFTGPKVHDATRKLSIPQLAALIGLSRCFVGPDSGLLHVAGATAVPIVGLFTCAKGEYRLPYRNGAYGTNCAAVAPNLPCYGCLHEERPPVVFCDCKRGDFACLSDITPARVLQAMLELTGGW